jgi:hypothetical protein
VPYFVGLDTDHNLYIRSLTQGWQPLTTASTYCNDNPAAVMTGSPSAATITVGCTGSDHGLYVASGTFDTTSSVLPRLGPWSGWGGWLKYGPAVAVVQGILSFFVIGSDSGLYTRGSGDNRWFAMNWQCIGHPAVATSADGFGSYLACQGLDHALWWAYYVVGDLFNGWTVPRSAGGMLIDGPGVVASSATAFTFYAEGTDHAVYHTGFTSPLGSNPTGWQYDGGVIQYGVGATASPLISVDCFTLPCPL